MNPTVPDLHAFHGFPREGIQFLADLARNNNKTWFETHRGVYEAAVLVPALLFAESMGRALQTIAPTVHPEPRVGGSVFRIYRDVRYSQDRRQYKTHVGIRLRDRDTARSPKCSGPLFYVEVDATHVRLGVGIKAFDRNTLDEYRRSVTKGTSAKVLDEMVRLATSRDHAILGDVLSRPPKGYEEHKACELLRRKGLFVRSERGLPKDVHSAAFVRFCLREFEPYAPLFHALRKVAVCAST